MILEINNINRIKHAKVKIGGLTVIAGENDTGKSTVGKVLFSMIKALSRQKEDLAEGKENKIRELLDQLFYKLRRWFVAAESSAQASFFPPRFFDELKPFLQLSNISTQEESDTNQLLRKELSDLFLGKKTIINTMRNLPEQEKVDSIVKLDEVKKILEQEEDPVDVLHSAMSKVLHSEFTSSLCAIATQDSSIILNNGVDFLLNVQLKNDKVVSFGVDNFDNLLAKPFDDATFIETPLYLQLNDVLRRAGTLLETGGSNRISPKVPLHVKDLTNKLELSKYYNKEKNDSLPIEKIINGRFYYDKEIDEFVFFRKIRDQNVRVKTSNVASGIKVFGIIQLLQQAQEVSARKVLVIDEPENHLHPKWQVDFARLLVDLVKKHIPIVLSSHSPYFIQAINHFAKEEQDIAEDINYYLAEITDEDMTEFVDVTNDLNKVFSKLAEPFQKIM